MWNILYSDDRKSIPKSKRLKHFQIEKQKLFFLDADRQEEGEGDSSELSLLAWGREERNQGYV